MNEPGELEEFESCPICYEPLRVFIKIENLWQMVCDGCGFYNWVTKNRLKKGVKSGANRTEKGNDGSGNA